MWFCLLSSNFWKGKLQNFQLLQGFKKTCFESFPHLKCCSYSRFTGLACLVLLVLTWQCYRQLCSTNCSKDISISVLHKHITDSNCTFDGGRDVMCFSRLSTSMLNPYKMYELKTNHFFHWWRKRGEANSSLFLKSTFVLHTDNKTFKSEPNSCTWKSFQKHRLSCHIKFTAFVFFLIYLSKYLYLPVLSISIASQF